jgi:hypothetical protein
VEKRNLKPSHSHLALSGLGWFDPTALMNSAYSFCPSLNPLRVAMRFAQSRHQMYQRCPIAEWSLTLMPQAAQCSLSAA